jgi:hypothetical protein
MVSLNSLPDPDFGKKEKRSDTGSNHPPVEA